MGINYSEIQSDDLVRTNQLLQEEIAELKKTQESLRISEEKFRNVFKNSPVGKAILNLDGDLQTNQTFQQILGYSEQELLKIDWRDITHPDDLANDLEIRASILSGERSSAHWKKRFIHKNGHIVWVEIGSNLQRDIGGNPLYFITTIQDITESKLATEAIESQHTLLAALINSSSDIIIFSLDKNFCYTTFNEKHREEMKLVWNADIKIGMNLLDCMQIPEVRELARQSIDRTLGGEAFIEIQHQPEPSIYYEFSWNPIWQNKEVVGATVFIQNITERNQAEIALRDEKDQIRTILDLVGDPIFVKDNDHRITLANRAFYDLFCMEESSVIGFTLVEAVPENERHHFLKVDRNVLDTGNPDIQEEELTVGDNMHFIITRKTRFTDESGEKFLVGSIHDITERKLAEETLRETNEYLQNLINHANAPIIVWDDEFKITRFNAAFENLSGYNTSDVIGRRVDILFPKDKVESSLELINRTAFGERWETVEIEILRTDGEIRMVLWNSANIFDATGNEIVATIAQGQDITKRKLAEENLILANSRLRSFIDSNIIGVIIATPDGKILETNDYYLKTIGFTREEFEAGKVDWLSITPLEWLPADERAIQEMRERGTCTPYEKEYLRRDGSRVAVLLADAMLPGPENQIVAFALDITDRKKAEEEIRKHTGRLQNLHTIDQAIMEAIESPEAVVQTALHYMRDLLQCQRASVGIFDLEKKEVQVYAADIDGKTIVQIGKVLTEEVYGVIEILRQNKIEIIENMSTVSLPSAINQILQAEEIQSSINVALLTALEMYGVLNVGWENPRTITKEEIEIAVEVANQITIAIEKARLLKETKGYAAKLEQRVADRTAQLESANKELEAFSYSVSHDLRAPLRHISGFSEMLSKDSQIQLPEKSQHYLEIINTSARKMGTLIDDLLSFSRTGRAEMNKSNFPMNQVLDDAILQIKISTERRKISWKIASLPEVFGDFNLVRLAWINLLDNAVKYTGPRERAVIHIDCTEEKEEYVFSIRDNGVGFEMKYANKLFGVFQRLHSIEEFEGTGIGLANVRRIISRHGGRTWADAKLDQGATFYFTLPKKSIEKRH